MFGSAVGIAIAVAAFQAFRSLGAGLPQMMEIRLDWAVILYSLTCAVGASIIFGLFPALRTARAVADANSHRRTETIATNRLQWMLVGIQVALSVTLLFGAGLLIRSFDRLARVPPGFDASRVMTFRITGNWGETTDMAGLRRRMLTALDALRSTPGVAAAATSVAVPGVSFRYDTELRIVEDTGRRHDTNYRSQPICFSRLFRGASDSCHVRHSMSGQRGPAPTAVVDRSFEGLYLKGRTATRFSRPGNRGTADGCIGNHHRRGRRRERAGTERITGANDLLVQQRSESHASVSCPRALEQPGRSRRDHSPPGSRSRARTGRAQSRPTGTTSRRHARGESSSNRSPHLVRVDRDLVVRRRPLRDLELHRQHTTP